MKIKYIIYPPICVCCNNVIKLNRDFDESFICKSCLSEAREYISTENLCILCSRPIDIDSKQQVKEQKCSHCLEFEDDFYFEKNLSVIEYNGYYAKLLRKFKFGYNKNISNAFVKILEEYLLENKDFFDKFDIITSVPIYKNRKRYRGFNQSELIGEKICKIVDKPFEKNILVKIKSTYPQTSVPHTERKNNIKDAIVLGENVDIKNKEILLVDDVFTTGSTINECARILSENGCRSVSSFTVLKSKKIYKKD